MIEIEAESISDDRRVRKHPDVEGRRRQRGDHAGHRIGAIGGEHALAKHRMRRRVSRRSRRHRRRERVKIRNGNPGLNIARAASRLRRGRRRTDFEGIGRRHRRLHHVEAAVTFLLSYAVRVKLLFDELSSGPVIGSHRAAGASKVLEATAGRSTAIAALDLRHLDLMNARC